MASSGVAALSSASEQDLDLSSASTYGSDIDEAPSSKCDTSDSRPFPKHITNILDSEE